MLLLALIVFASCVLTVIFWAAVVAAAGVILGAVWLMIQGIWWAVTRPIVWLVIRPIQFIFGIKREAAIKNVPASRRPMATSTHPPRPASDTPSSMATRVEQLGKLKDLLEGGAISQQEFESMKKEVLAS